MGDLANDDVGFSLIPTSISMVGGSAAVTTASNGGGLEYCDPSTDVCKEGCPTAAFVCNGGPSLPIGTFQRPSGVAIDSQGVIYLQDGEGSAARVQRFTPTPTPGSPPYASYVPTDFDPTDLHDAPIPADGQTREFTIGPNDHLLALKSAPAGFTTCPDGSASKVEYHILDISPAGSYQDTHGICGEITGYRLAANTTSGNMYVPGTLPNPSGFGNTSLIRAISDTSSPTAAIDTVTPNTSGATITGTLNPNGPDPNFLNSPSTSSQIEYKRTVDTTWTAFGNPIRRSVEASPTRA